MSRRNSQLTDRVARATQQRRLARAWGGLRPMSGHPRWIRRSAAFGLLSLVFVWGYIAHARGVPPDALVRWLASATGLVSRAPQPAAERDDWRTTSAESRSPAVEPWVALPYLSGLPPRSAAENGVVVWDEQRAEPGLNFYNSGGADEAVLIDMRGRVAHRWSLPGFAVHHAELLPGGDLLVVAQRRGLLRVDARSRIRWRLAAGWAHHDATAAADGTLWYLSHHDRPAPRIHRTLLTRADLLRQVSADGEILREVDLLDAIERSPFAFLLPALHREAIPADAPPLDVLHTNHVEAFDGSLADRNGLFARGNLLVSVRNLNAIAILDGDSLEILWLWGPGNLHLQHQPRLLPTGRILIFDNGLSASRVIELEPLAGIIAWAYQRGEAFFSKTRGGAQRLPGGNTLITESDRGEAFEVTPDGEVVWRFANPERDDDGNRRNLWRVSRIPREELGWLGGSESRR